MSIGGDVLVQSVHERPGFLFAERLKPGGDVEEACAGGIGVGHHDMALVFGLREILPAGWRRQAELPGLHGIVTESRHICVHPYPARRLVAVHESRVECLYVLRRIRFEHAL